MPTTAPRDRGGTRSRPGYSVAARPNVAGVTYERPVVDELTFRDVDGSVINYGDRWGGGSPPTDTYSVDTHPERFAPLHVVADALIHHLQHEYIVQVSDDLSCAADLLRPGRGAVRAVRIIPAVKDAAAMTFVFTDYPGFVVHAGLMHDFPYPVCGCEACDETWDAAADDLERTVLAVASGRYREEIRPRHDSSWISFDLTDPDGSGEQGGASISADDSSTLDAASARLTSLPDGTWASWPRRATPQL